jgi:hypothetical protein
VSPTRNKSLTAAAITSTVLAVSMLGMPSQAATSGAAGRASGSVREAGDAGHRSAGSYDARRLTGTALVKADRRELSSRTKADKAYYRSLGTQGVLDIDPLTGTPRDLGRLNGFLTGRSTAPARTVAMTYVRHHLGALGLTKADLKTFRLRQDYVDSTGLHNLSWTQSVRGGTVFGNGLRIKVTRDGRVLSVQGSPVSGLARLAANAPSAGRVTASAARTAAAHDVRGTLAQASVAASRAGSSARTVWSNHDVAQRVWFLTASGLRPGWSTYVQSSAGSFQHVIDAASGRVLYRHSNTAEDNGDALVFDNYPGAARGGKAKVVNFFKRGWLKRSATFLKGDSVTAFLDLNDDDAIQARERTPVPGTKHGAQFKLKRFGTAASGFCAKWVCSWNPNKTRSWKANKNSSTTNAFYFASNFHDYLAKSPIRFTRAAGNFSAGDHDPVRLNNLDGAATDHGMPDGNHIDNANMSTPPDGISPTMQMYLFHFPGTSDDPVTGDPFVPTTGSLDASVLYHEYTHGLSNRLVIDANGNSTLNSIQSRSMGEAWSDYYAMDYLVTKGFLKDTKKSGDLLEGKYVAANKHLIRTMAIDCAVGATKPKGCKSGFDPSVKGGYTYGDFPNVIGEPEVHGSGEIWGQTLWDLRNKLGHVVTDTIVTRGMSLAADDPDFLDMRNAILRADLVAYNGSHTKAIWKVFAHRGMGFFAGSLDSADQAPAQDFHVPPANNPHDGTIAGFVTDPGTGDPVQGALVQVTGQSARTTTGPDGFYEIDNLVTGTYKKVLASAPGYLGDAHAGTAVSFGDFTGADLTDFEINRDWASNSGRAEVVDFDGPDYTFFGCGPLGALDTSLTTGWGSVTGHENPPGNPVPTNVFEPKSITVKLPTAVDIDSFQIDPAATCGDGGSASTGDFMIETSTNGTSFDVAAEDTFVASDRGHLNEVDPAPGTGNDVQFVRFTIESNQTPDFATSCPDGPFDGCTFTDLTEFAVLGTAAP